MTTIPTACNGQCRPKQPHPAPPGFGYCRSATLDIKGDSVANKQAGAVSAETIDRVAQQAQLTPEYLLFMALAGLLAGVALLSNSIPILVGSMVIAPALAPLALVAFALVAGRPGLALRGLRVGLVGLLAAAVFAVLIAWIMNVTNVIPPHTNLLNKPLLEERVRPGWWGLAAAFAAGIIGIESLLRDKTDSIVGTVAALALVPAAAAGAIALLAGDPRRALGGLLLLTMNVGLIVAMGILTLLVRTIREGVNGRGSLVLLAIAIIATIALLLALAQTPKRPPQIKSSTGLSAPNLEPQPGRGQQQGRVPLRLI